LVGQKAFWLGLAASAALLAAFAYLFLPRQDIGDVLRDADLRYVLPSLVLYFLAVWARSWRWRYILRPLIGKPRRSLYPVVVVGYMANNILPIRLGEIVRSYYTSLREPISPAAAFGTVAVERASDVVTLLFFLAVVWIALPTSGLLDELSASVPGGAPVLISVSVLPFIGVTGVMVVISLVSESTVLRWIGRFLTPMPPGIQAKALSISERLIEGLTVLRSPKALGAVLLMSLPVWLFEAAMLAVIALGFDIADSFDTNAEFLAAILLFTAVANLAGVVPSVSGGIGPFEFFGAATLVAAGVADAEAATYVITAHVALLVPVSILGVVMLLLDGTSLRSLVKKAETGPAGLEIESSSDAPESAA
jgi:uncharacterized protein (TIRG00374 family)